jgi:hypothetical protein
MALSPYVQASDKQTDVPHEERLRYPDEGNGRIKTPRPTSGGMGTIYTPKRAHAVMARRR